MNIPTQSLHEYLPTGTVLIAGGGPVGLLLATVLSHHKVRSVLLERNETTTKWPKMDLTNARSMEIFRRLGLSDGLRERGVPSHISHDVLISTGLGNKDPVTKWLLPSVDEFRERIRVRNDGSQPREPWQRISQVKFEAWLKVLCMEDEMVDARFGWKIEHVEEKAGRVRTIASCLKSGECTEFISDYVVGCDGASSKVRRSLQMPLDGGPMPTCALLVHFKSRDLTRLHAQGQFWHIFFLLEPGAFGGVIIAQDEIETWTVHYFLPLGTDTSQIGSEEAVYTVLGGLKDKYEIKIDEILVRSVWTPSIAVARTWASTERHVFIAGDAAHQNIPTGGYGMNMGIGDAYDLGWKLAATIHYGGTGLLESYEAERRPVALRNAEHSGHHMQVHQSVSQFFDGIDPHIVDLPTEDGRALRRKIHEHYQMNDGENKDFGIEMGYVYESGILRTPAVGTKPVWQASEYIPSTWPGSRAPHVFLKDGSAIFDRLGKDWTLVTFSDEGPGVEWLLNAAKVLAIPIKHLNLRGEDHARRLWQQNLVLVRPDEHVAWSSDLVDSAEEAKIILEIAIGMRSRKLEPGTAPGETEHAKNVFTATTEMKSQVYEYDLHSFGDSEA